MTSLRAIGFLFIGSVLSCTSLRADPAPMESSSSDPNVHIYFKSYQKTSDGYAFELYLMDLPPNQQPGLKKMGAPIGYKDFVVGTFSVNMFKTTVGDGPPTMVDASTLELIDPKAGRKVVLTYHAPTPPPQ
jgi:hypothetical protein